MAALSGDRVMPRIRSGRVYGDRVMPRKRSGRVILSVAAYTVGPHSWGALMAAYTRPLIAEHGRYLLSRVYWAGRAEPGRYVLGSLCTEPPYVLRPLCTEPRYVLRPAMY